MQLPLLQLVTRYTVPIAFKIAVLAIFIIVCILIGGTKGWLQSIGQLALMPFQRFAWQSEQYVANSLNRSFSIITSILVLSCLIFTYQIKNIMDPSDSGWSYLAIVLGIAFLFLIKLLANKIFFTLHKSQDFYQHLIDFQYSISQWVTFIVVLLLLLDVFYFRLSGNFHLVIVGVLAIYFLIRLYGTILLFQNEFEYPIVSIFIYLCTFEIVPSLILVKELFISN